MINKLIVHLGTHKTATTYLQKEIGEQRIDLNSKYIDFIPLDETRKIFSSQFFKTNNNRLRENLFESINLPTQNLIISDENLIGNPNLIASKGLIYPHIDSVLAKIKSCFPNSKTVIVMSFRNIKEFLPSMYCEFLRHNLFIPFDEYIRKIDMHKINWFEIMNKQCSEHSSLNFVFTNFDNFKTNKELVLKALTFGELERFKSNSKSRATLTDEAIKFLTLFPNISWQVLRKMEAVDYVYGRKFSPYSETEIQQAKQINAEQLLSLSRLSNVEVIS